MPVSLCLSVNDPLRKMRTEEEMEKFRLRERNFLATRQNIINEKDLKEITNKR